VDCALPNSFIAHFRILQPFEIANAPLDSCSNSYKSSFSLNFQTPCPVGS
jgi:hypothetical protein